jgi:hypothetical protein
MFRVTVATPIHHGTVSAVDLCGRRRAAAQRLVKALSPVISRPTIKLWMASVPS